MIEKNKTIIGFPTINVYFYAKIAFMWDWKNINRKQEYYEKDTFSLKISQ